MKKLLSVMVVGMMITTSVFADDLSSSDLLLDAAPNESAVTTSANTSISAGEYASVSCNSNTAFAVNSCDQCFDGGSVKTGVPKTGLGDNWTNTSSSTLIAYQDEQKTPTMIKIGNSNWLSSPADETKIFKNGVDVVWTPAGDRTSFMLGAGQKVRFWDADFGASYTLQNTDKKNGDLVGILKFPVVYRTLDSNTATEGSAVTHYECVAYKLDAPTVSTPETPKPETPNVPKEVTQTETGPETLLLVAVAFFIAFGMMFVLRRRV